MTCLSVYSLWKLMLYRISSKNLAQKNNNILLKPRPIYIHHSIYVLIRSVGSSSTTNPKPRGNPPTACSGKPMSTQQRAEPLRCLALRTRGGTCTCDDLCRSIFQYSVKDRQIIGSANFKKKLQQALWCCSVEKIGEPGDEARSHNNYYGCHTRGGQRMFCKMRGLRLQH